MGTILSVLTLVTGGSKALGSLEFTVSGDSFWDEVTRIGDSEDIVETNDRRILDTRLQGLEVDCFPNPEYYAAG